MPSRHPSQLDQTIALQSQEAAVVRMALRLGLSLALENGLEEERGSAADTVIERSTLR
jgi:hypothetical protein